MRRVIALLHPSYTVRGVGARQRRPSRRLAARHGTRTGAANAILRRGWVLGRICIVVGSDTKLAEGGRVVDAARHHQRSTNVQRN